MGVSFQSTPVIANGRIEIRDGVGRGFGGFNPRPLLLTGESPSPWKSMLSRPVFQSTPVIANGRIAMHQQRTDLLDRFQSTPVIANGRIVRRDRAGAGGQHVSIHARYC